MIRVLKIDRWNPHIEEFLIGFIYTIGFISLWTI